VVNNPQQQKEDFIMPRSSYRGEFTPEHLVFNANLQEFANRVSLLCGLETGGKISTLAAYQEIKKLWKELKASKKNLLETSDPPEKPSDPA
jgi:hypothetical protein